MEKMFYAVRFLAATLFVFLSATVVKGFNYSLPLVTNFTALDYNAQLQNWCVQQDGDGLCYFGNNAGVLCYDGYNWELWPLPSSHIVRSLLVDGDSLFVGSFEEFGSLKWDTEGRLTYTSLSERLVQWKYKDEDFWNIVKCGDVFYFQSFASVYRYTPADGRVSMVAAAIEGTNKILRPLYIFALQGQLYAQDIDNNGFYRLTEHGWSKVWSASEYSSFIVALIGGGQSKAAVPADGTVVCTQDDGLYRVSGGMLQHFRCSLDDDIPRCRINRALQGRGGEIIIGTIGDGVYAMDSIGRRLWHINHLNGLNNNSVLGLMQDSQDNIWVTLDDGISFIQTGEPYTLLRPGRDEPSIGMCYAMEQRGDDLIIATNQGVYVFNTTNNSYSMMEGTTGQSWYARTFDDQTFIGCNEKTLIIERDGSQTVLPWCSTDTKKGIVNGTEILVQTSYYDVHIFKRSNSLEPWRLYGTVKGMFSPLRQVEIDSDGTIWCSHISKGVIKATLSENLDSVLTLKEYPSLQGDTAGELCFIMKIRGKIVFSNTQGFYLYDEEHDCFVSYDKMNEELPMIRHVCNATPVDDNMFWLASSDAYYLIAFEDGHFHNKMTIPLANFTRSCNGANGYVCHTSEGVCYFMLNNALGRIDFKHIDRREFSPAFKIRSIGFLNKENNMTYLPVNSTTTEKTLPEATHGNLEVTLSYPNYQKLPYRYHFVLKGGKTDIETTTSEPHMIYPRLNSGKYTLLCNVIDDNGRQLASLSYLFRVPWPPYLRWWAFLCYILAAVAVVVLVARVYSQWQIRRRQWQIEVMKAKQEQQIHEQQLIIAEQQKRLLESELSEKSKELASVAFDAYTRQHVINNMRETLYDLQRKGSPVARDAEKILNTISQSDTGNREFWNIFERNFDLIHEHFFRNLREAFPQLTSTDLKFCALLRLNMSTKNIANFTNVTVRGVETARLRLRRKLALSHNQSLVQFLIDFKPQ